MSLAQNDYPNPDNIQEVSFPQEVIPPTAEPDVDTMFVRYNPAWSQVLASACDQLLQYSAWLGTHDEKKQAVNRAEVLKILLQIPVEIEAMGGCCYDNIQYRLNTSGDLEQSVNGGAWTVSPNDPRDKIPLLPPPTIDGTHTKCDAASNALANMQDAMNKYANQLENGSNLSFMAAAIVGILFLFLDLTLVGALITPLLLEIAGALIQLNANDFKTYFTSDVWHQVLCALYCSTDDDGTLSASGLARFITKLNSDMTGGVGKDIFIKSMMAASLNTINNWMRIGDSTSADCSDCTCDTFCDFSGWTIHLSRGSIVERTTDHITVKALKLGSTWWVDVQSTGADVCCCDVNYIVESGSFAGGGTVGWGGLCGTDPDTDAGLIFAYTGESINRVGLSRPDAGGSDAGFTVKIFSSADCP